MIRKIFLLSCVAMMFAAGRAYAQEVDFTIDSVTYRLNLSQNYASVYDCDKTLKSVVIPASVDYGGESYPVRKVGLSAFSECKTLVSIELPDGITDIEDRAFYECRALVSLDLPDELSSIGDYAFGWCTSMKSICFPANLGSLGSDVFYKVDLEEIHSLASTPPTCQDDTFTGYIYLNAKLYVPEGSENAYRNAKGWDNFYNRIAIDGVVYLLDWDERTAAVVYYTDEIGDAVVCESMEKDGIEFVVTRIEDNAFDYCDSLTSIVIPNTVTYIGAFAFRSCNNLESVELPDGINEIGRNTFECCYKLKFIEIPESVKTIRMWAFSSCKALKNVVFHEGLENIEMCAFETCGALETVKLPASLKSIDYFAFNACTIYSETRLKNVYSFACLPPEIDEDAFTCSTAASRDVYEIATLHVLPGCEETYRSAAGWEKFKNIVGDADLSVSDASVDAGFEVHCADGIVATVVPARIEVYAESGALVLCEDNAMRCDLSPLPGGVYIVRISAMGQNRVLKVVR